MGLHFVEITSHHTYRSKQRKDTQDCCDVIWNYLQIFLYPPTLLSPIKEIHIMKSSAQLMTWMLNNLSWPKHAVSDLPRGQNALMVHDFRYLHMAQLRKARFTSLVAHKQTACCMFGCVSSHQLSEEESGSTKYHWNSYLWLEETQHSLAVKPESWQETILALIWYTANDQSPQLSARKWNPAAWSRYAHIMDIGSQSIVAGNYRDTLNQPIAQSQVTHDLQTTLRVHNFLNNGDGQQSRLDFGVESKSSRRGWRQCNGMIEAWCAGCLTRHL